ncbi:MAG: M17 family peptidase N-terminal domain-containing protein, partial [Cellulosilyticaceae bacterium]
MIHFEIGKEMLHQVIFVKEASETMKNIQSPMPLIFKGKALDVWTCTYETGVCSYIGLGDVEDLSPIRMKELGAKATKEMKKLGVQQFAIQIDELVEAKGIDAICYVAEGCLLGDYVPKQYKEKPQEVKECIVSFQGINGEDEAILQARLQEVVNLNGSVIQARNWVNAPGNKLRPEQFVAEIQALFEGTAVEVEVFDEVKLREMGMEALLAVGTSS